MHDIIRILNVGQGDSILVKPYLPNTLLLIDAGPRGSHINRYISDEEIHLIITHHHSDHVGGLKSLIQEKGKQVRKMYLPAQYNELALISEAILHLKSRDLSKESEPIFSMFKNIQSNQLAIFDAANQKQSPVELRLLYDGAVIENKYECLNPPRIPLIPNWINEVDTEQFVQMLHTLFQTAFADDLSRILFEDIKNDHMTNDVSKDYHTVLPVSKGNDPYRFNRDFILHFFISNHEVFEAFHQNPSYENALSLYKLYTSVVHDCCIVIKTLSSPNTILLSSDASKNVFYRLHYENKLKNISVFQMPHHGSKKNIDKTIIDYIRPKAVFISHGNRRFGRSIDSHPHTKVLEMLLARRINILLTNDVVKGNVTLMKKKNHSNFRSAYIKIEP